MVLIVSLPGHCLLLQHKHIVVTTTNYITFELHHSHSFLMASNKATTYRGLKNHPPQASLVILSTYKENICFSLHNGFENCFSQSMHCIISLGMIMLFKIVFYFSKTKLLRSFNRLGHV